MKTPDPKPVIITCIALGVLIAGVSIGIARYESEQRRRAADQAALQKSSRELRDFEIERQKQFDATMAEINEGTRKAQADLDAANKRSRHGGFMGTGLFPSSKP